MSRVQPISVAATLSLKCKQPNFTRAPAAQRMAIITSMNMALQDIYSLVPPTYREKTISLGISAPVTGTIDGYIASVGVKQQFQNPFDSKIEAVYVFPLPQKAAVNEFVMTVGDRRIRGIIRERQEAEKIYKFILV